MHNTDINVNNEKSIDIENILNSQDDNSISDSFKNKKSTSKNSNNLIDTKKVVLDTSVCLTVELGRSKIKIKDFLNFSQGSMLILNKFKEEPLNIFINGFLIASGEIVVLDNKYGIRITNIQKPVEYINTPV